MSPNSTPRDYFGHSVAIDGDTALIGAYTADSTGAVYLYARENEGWTLQTELLASDAAVGGRFGYKVALDGDTRADCRTWRGLRVRSKRRYLDREGENIALGQYLWYCA